MKKKRNFGPPEWAKVPASRRIQPRVVEAIARRRRQMLVHSYLYYHLDSPVVEDHTWTKWAQQLATLQQKFGSQIGFYDDAFSDWNGSSGFHLPVDAGVINSAKRILAEVREREDILS